MNKTKKISDKAAINFLVDAGIKDEFGKICRQAGISLTSALSLYVHQAVAQRKIFPCLSGNTLEVPE